jgi:undecaprenyl diphosphate synthase
MLEQEPLGTNVPADAGMHVAIIMDGNGRWATARGLPRVIGHRQGVAVVREVVHAAVEAPVAIGRLTMYAFSADNWQRPAAEVLALMRLFEAFFEREAVRAVEQRVRISVIGRRDRLSPALVAAIACAERRTRRCERLHVRFAVDYSGREAIWAAARSAWRGRPPTRSAFEAAIASGHGVPAQPCPVDLLVRTGGEQRLSDFLLWECAYAELYFTPTLWPDFTGAELHEALTAFQTRDRRFGRLPAREAMPSGELASR